MNCSRKECQNVPRYQVGLLLFAPRGPWSDEPIKSTMLLYVCEAHQKETTAESILTDAGWATILRALSAANAMPPERKRTKIWFKPLAVTQ